LTTIYESPLEIVSVHDIESIDVFKGAGAAIFGVRGGGGAISITTKRGNSDRSNEIHDLNYTVYTPIGFQKPVEFYSPIYETLESKHLTIPDYRTTIFWKPDIVVSDDDEEATFDFYTSDFTTTYSVVIEGLTTDGRIIRQVEKIQVE
jgi:TonB-dependent SusC/RagA subfamily outer membrane receptor